MNDKDPCRVANGSIEDDDNSIRNKHPNATIADNKENDQEVGVKDEMIKKNDDRMTYHHHEDKNDNHSDEDGNSVDDNNYCTIGEGYTPLSDLNDNEDGMVYFALPPSAMEGSSDDDDDDNNGEYGYNACSMNDAYTMINGDGNIMSIPANDLVSSSTDTTPALESAYHNSNSSGHDDDFGNGNLNANPNTTTDCDYLSLANQALMSLEMDYANTVRMTKKINNNNISNSNENNIEPLTTSISNTTPCDTTTDQLDVDQSPNFVPNWEECAAPTAEEDDDAADPSNVVTAFANTAALPAKALPNIDTDAVRRAVRTISDRHPVLQDRLQQWQQQKDIFNSSSNTNINNGKNVKIGHNDMDDESKQQQKEAAAAANSSKCIAPREHTIIPIQTLKVFRKSSMVTPPPPQNSSSTSSTSSSSSSSSVSNNNILKTSANLSRAATIANALDRLVLSSPSLSLQTFANGDSNRHKISTLQIHIVGADYVECESEQRIRVMFEPLARWIQQIQQQNNKDEKKEYSSLHYIQDLQILLVGPNVPMTAPTHKISLINNGNNNCSNRNGVNDDDYDNNNPNLSSDGSSPGQLRHAYVECRTQMYHDWLEDKEAAETSHTKSDNVLNIVFLFNAGLWGYDDWLPTIQYLIKRSDLKNNKNDDRNGSQKNPIGIPLIITSYTIEEAQDDYETMIEQIKIVKEQHMDMKLEGQEREKSRHPYHFWLPELNPFGSKQKLSRRTVPNGREYYDNAAWQAWCL